MPEHTIAENLQRLQTAKTAIGNAITAKGGTVGANDGLEDFASDIATIPSGGGDSDLVDLIERDITSLDIPNTCTSIGDNAFYSLSSLTSITIPSSVTAIGSNAFNECRSLTSITIPSSVKTIGTNTFYNCDKITSVTLSDGLWTIGSNAFYACRSLTSITIPSSVTTIGSNAFKNTGLTTITINKATGSISGAPWGATNATVTWTG